MYLDQFNSLPEWDKQLVRIPKGEAWKWREELQLGEVLYNQWRKVFGLATAFAEALPGEEEANSPKDMIYQNVYMIAPKIMSAAGDTLYQVKMENAALIRFNCRQLWEQVAFAVLTGTADAAYQQVIEESLSKFKALFRRWVATFKPDDCEDDWGLF